MRADLRSRGFRSKNARFRSEVSGNSVVVALQERKNCNIENVLMLTVNVGVHSARLAKRMGREVAEEWDVWRCHWRRRLARDGQEQWLRFSLDEEDGVAAGRIRDAVLSMVPALLAHASDEALRDEWLAGRSENLGAMERLLHLSILISEIGPVDRLDAVLEELRQEVAGRLQEPRVLFELEAAGVTRARSVFRAAASERSSTTPE